MVKKKTPEQEPVRHDETSDIKPDNDMRSDDVQAESSIPSPEESTGPEKMPDEEKGNESDKSVKKEPTAEEKLADMQDRYLRLSAEFDNYRKRTLREKIEISKYAGEELILKLLPVMDDFERALATMESATDCSAIKSGIDLIYSKFTDFLKQNEVREIESADCAFNVDLHDAVAKAPVDEETKKGVIVDVVKKGYYLKDKVIRHAKVVIGE